MVEAQTLRHYQLRDTFTPVHPIHSYQAWRGDTVRFAFTHKITLGHPHWDVTDRDEAALAALQLHPLHAGLTLTLQVPDQPDVTIRQHSVKKWEIVFPDFSLTVNKTDDYKLPILDKDGTRSPRYIIFHPNGLEADAIRIYGPPGKFGSVHVAKMRPLTALSLAVGIAYRDRQIAVADGIFSAATYIGD
ncbi:MAG: hypothetical protein WCP28_16020 [Actinomycetes bacterium]